MKSTSYCFKLISIGCTGFTGSPDYTDVWRWLKILLVLLVRLRATVVVSQVCGCRQSLCRWRRPPHVVLEVRTTLTSTWPQPVWASTNQRGDSSRWLETRSGWDSVNNSPVFSVIHLVMLTVCVCVCLQVTGLGVKGRPSNSFSGWSSGDSNSQSSHRSPAGSDQQFDWLILTVRNC